VSRHAPPPPAGAICSCIRHRIPFYETDAMGIVHHANYVRFLELARILWMDEHHRPYREYVAEGRHFATTHIEVDYQRGLRFDDTVEVTTWMSWVRGASLRMEYRLEGPDGAVASAASEHAMVDDAGRPRRIPREQREELRRLATA